MKIIKIKIIFKLNPLKLIELVNKMKELGRETARNVPNSEISPEPREGELKFLEGLIGGKKACKEMKATLHSVANRCLSARAETAMEKALSECGYNKNLHKLNQDYRISLIKAFTDSYSREKLAKNASNDV